MKFLVTGGAGFIDSAVIGVLGHGYVGLPLMLRYSELGFKVLGIDKESFDKRVRA